jgi:hypothetical protein
MAQALEAGHAKIRIAGEKVRGGYLLQRTGGGRKPRWLLVKLPDEDAEPGSDLVSERPRSVLSGKTIDEL